MNSRVTGAVITADIVNSTGIASTHLKKVMKTLEAVLKGFRYEFYRGDSFQVYVSAPEDALSLLLKARTAVMKLTAESSLPETDIRASIGIGWVRLPVKTLSTATDEAFILSGRAFDQMNHQERCLMACNDKNKKVNLGLKVMAHFVDYIFQRITAKQAAVVYELLMQRTQVEAARRLKKSQATIHQHSQSASWPDIEKLLVDYRLFIETIEI